MFPEPFLIEDELIISKQELEKSKNDRFDAETEWKETQEISYCTDITNCLVNNNTLSLTLYLQYEESTKLNGNVFFHIESANYSVECKEFECGDFYDNRMTVTWRIEEFCTLTDILNPEKSFIVDEKLTIKVKGIFFIEENDSKRRKTLAKLLWNRSDDRDFIISVGKKGESKTDIKIHKCVLASRSSVFDAMLQHGMKEKAENKLDIIDFEAEVVQAAVEYFYDRDTFKSLKLHQLIDLLQFSDKYVINDMKDALQQAFLPRINPNTVCQIANASIIFNSLKLKKFCNRCLNLYSRTGILFDNVDTLDDYFKENMEECGFSDDDCMVIDSSDEESDA